jgi:hypothetical protein
VKALLYHHGILQLHGMKALLSHHGILQLHGMKANSVFIPCNCRIP